MKCTSTSCQIKIGDRVFETLVISKDEAESYATQREEGQVQVQKVNPDYFYLPFEGVNPGENVFISFTYFETLIFWENAYRVRIPLKLKPETLPSLPLEQIISLKGSINAGTKNTQWGSTSHQLICESQTESRVVVKSNPEIPWENRDFDISYRQPFYFYFLFLFLFFSFFIYFLFTFFFFLFSFFLSFFLLSLNPETILCSAINMAPRGDTEGEK